MTYDKALVSGKQKAVFKSITDLLDVLSEIEADDAGGNTNEIVLEDGSVMTLSLVADKGRNPLQIEKISVSNARLNIDINISKSEQSALSKADDVIRIVKKKPEKITLTVRKKD